jgi:hypothetical protein
MARHESAEFHGKSARMIVGMRNIGAAGLPDDCANPTNGGHDHVHDGPEHEHLERAKPGAEFAEEQA